jgi:integrating conjugative element protein (TIGR03755 family)
MKTSLVTAALMALAIHAAAEPVVPGDRSILYYKIGGGEPVSRPANPSTTTLKIGLGGTARLSYSCGRFDAGITIENLMNGFSKLGTAISGAVKAGIAALPMYIFQRASPGLYELFQTYQKKAETEWNISLKTCEEMEAQIKQGGDPYAEWLSMAKGEHWKDESKSTQDAAEAKRRVETDGGTKGLTWIGGARKGGRNQDAIEVIRDITQAGYNVTLNRPPAAPATAAYPPTTKLAAAFPTPKVAADWAVSVIGDRQISLCDEVGCQAKSATPGSGLLPKYEAERPTAEKQLDTVVNSTAAPTYADLEKASAPGVAITRELVEALRGMRPTDRRIVLGRLAMEVAQARIVDKALMVRNVMLTGGGVPEAGWEPAQKELRERVDQLNRHMDDLLFETRMRREVVSTTARDVLEAFRAERVQSTSTRQQDGTDQRPMENGRVQ